MGSTVHCFELMLVLKNIVMHDKTKGIDSWLDFEPCAYCNNVVSIV